MEKTFLIIVGIFGLLWIFLVPPMQTPDEPNQFGRAYAVSQGDFFCNIEGNLAGNFLPVNIKQFNDLVPDPTPTKEPFDYYKFFHNTKLRESPGKENTFISLFSMCVYTPIPYIPQAIGILAGKTLDLSTPSTFYLARISNFSFFLLLSWLAIKITPILKPLFFLIALLPMNLYEGISTSADVFTNSITLFFVALIFNIIFEKKYLKIGHILFLGFLTLIIAASKNTYFPFFLLFSLIPPRKLGGLKRFITFFSIIAILNLLLIMAWKHFTTQYDFMWGNFIEGVNPQTQLSAVIQNPINFSITFIETFLQNFFRYGGTFVGVFGWQNTPLPAIVVAIYFVIVILITTTIKSSKNKFNLRQRIIFFAISAIIIALIFMSLYAYWTPVNEGIVMGIQGRYFIPISILVLAGISATWTTKNKLIKHKLTPILLSVLMLMVSTVIIYLRYKTGFTIHY